MSTENSTQVMDYPFRAPNAVDPPEEWSKLRQGCPVAHIRMPSGDQAVLLTRYDDVRQVLADQRFTRNLAQDGASRIAANEGGSVFEQKEAAEISAGETHEKWRRFITRWFTVKRISTMQENIETMANHLIDEMVATGSPADLVKHLAFPLPVWVIAEILGISVENRDKLAFWSNSMLTMTQFTQEEVNRAQGEFLHFILGHIAQKRANPGDDLLSDLIRAADEGEKINERVLIMTAQGILVAGHETTSNMIAKMMAMLLSNRHCWEQLVADPSLVRTAVEEALRFDANGGFGLPRFVTEDIEVSGAKIPAQTTVICNMSAANRDDKAFERADEMILTRSPNPHLTFGMGPHSCVGQALARTELQTVLNVLLRRLPSLALAVPIDEVPRREGLLVGGVEKLLVRW